MFKKIEEMVEYKEVKLKDVSFGKKETSQMSKCIKAGTPESHDTYSLKLLDIYIKIKILQT